jgi:hypothetical protein
LRGPWEASGHSSSVLSGFLFVSACIQRLSCRGGAGRREGSRRSAPGLGWTATEGRGGADEERRGRGRVAGVRAAGGRADGAVGDGEGKGAHTN